MRADFPAALSRYVARVFVEPPSAPRNSVLEQTGEFRQRPDGPWLPFSAEQTIRADELAFCWHARIKMAPLVTAVVEDAFDDGHGRLDAKIWGILPVAHARGVQLDRGEAQRYLAELPWCPSALIYNPSLHFAPGDAERVRVWYGDPSTYVEFDFDADGDIVRTFSTTRCLAGKPTPWQGELSRYADFGGVRIPTRAEVSWLLGDEPFTYFKGNVTRFGFQ